MNNEILEISSRAGCENGLRDSLGFCCLLDPAANPRTLRSVHPQLSRKWRGKIKCFLLSFSPSNTLPVLRRPINTIAKCTLTEV